jgi:deazaflavin-dependent oxidoreductase (nitroreductase family)
MGVLEELGHTAKPPNVLRRGIQQVAASRPGAWLLKRTLHHLDKPLFKMSDGRMTAAGLLAGLPVVMLTTTGAKSGKERTMPLLAIPVGGDVAVLGTNFGQQSTPGWVYNLEADPTATIAYRDRSVSVTGRRATDGETNEVFELASGVYPGYANYRDRVDNRVIRVFVLEQST